MLPTGVERVGVRAADHAWAANEVGDPVGCFRIADIVDDEKILGAIAEIAKHRGVVVISLLDPFLGGKPGRLPVVHVRIAAPRPFDLNVCQPAVEPLAQVARIENEARFGEAAIERDEIVGRTIREPLIAPMVKEAVGVAPEDVVRGEQSTGTQHLRDRCGCRLVEADGEDFSVVRIQPQLGKKRPPEVLSPGA